MSKLTEAQLATLESLTVGRITFDQIHALILGHCHDGQMDPEALAEMRPRLEALVTELDPLAFGPEQDAAIARAADWQQATEAELDRAQDLERMREARWLIDGILAS